MKNILLLIIVIFMLSCESDEPMSYIIVKDATGIYDGTEVFYSGVKVGKVKGLELVEPEGVKVSIKLDSTNVLTERTFAFITRGASLISSRRIVLSEGGGALIPVGGEIEFRLSKNEVSKEITETLSSIMISSQIQKMRSEIDSLKSEIKDLKGNLNE